MAPLIQECTTDFTLWKDFAIMLACFVYCITTLFDIK